MTDALVAAPQSRPVRIGTWILRILLVLVFGAAGAAKLAGVAMLVAEFDKIGLGQWFRYLTGATEVMGAVLVLMPGFTFYGAILLLCVCGGAFIAQIGPLHGDVVHVFVLGTLAALTMWLTRPPSGG
jgi:putative oxidoreductase